MSADVRKRRKSSREKKPEEKPPNAEPCAAFEVEMFPAHVDSVSHPYADQFKEMLEDVAKEYECRLISFDIHKGTVTFSFDSDELNAEILRIIPSEPNP